LKVLIAKQLKMKKIDKIICLGIIAVTAFAACNNPKPAESKEATPATGVAAGEMDRSVLPIREPLRETYKELDAKSPKGRTQCGGGIDR
jgi:hypothetical protein